MKSIAKIGAVSALAALTDAKVTTTVDGRRTHHDVEFSINEDLCFFKNNDDYWCLAATPPMAKVGWEWKQTYTTTPSTESPVLKYYHLQFLLFSEVQGNIVSNLFLQNFWVNVITVDLSQFKSQMFFSLIFNEDFGICPGMGWTTEQILFRLLWTMKFWNCQKTLIDDLADFSSTWTGFYAQYFEDCNQSNNAEIILMDKEYLEAVEDQMWSGTVNAKSERYCKYPFNSSNVSAESYGMNQFAKLAYKTFFNWVVESYPDSFE